MEKTLRFGLVLTPLEKMAIVKLAEVEGGLSQAALVRRLIRKAAIEHGIWPERIDLRDSARAVRGADGAN